MFKSMEELLGEVSEFVKECLGPLGVSGEIQPNQVLDWAINFAIQIVATLILFLVVKIFLWKPITKFLESRSEQMDKDLEVAKEAKEKALELEKELAIKYDNAKVEIQKLLKAAESQGLERKEQIIQEAKEEALRRISLAEEEIQREISLQEADIKNQIISIAFLAAETIVGKEINREEYLQTVTKIIESGMKNE
jgi:F-type H+-transporting ATPase subunit b